jgi:hypothetical protein
MGVLLDDQKVGVLALGMQRVRRDHRTGQVEGAQQRREPGDLVGLALHAGLAQDDPGGLVEH